jgi:chemotaxis protein CheD
VIFRGAIALAPANGSSASGPGPRPEPKSDEATVSVFLQAGHLYVSPLPSLVTTILGSCVAVCLWDPVARIGGMNHFMLPYGVGPAAMSLRYAGHAMTALIDRLAEIGTERGRLVAKLFGGACVLAELRLPSQDLGMKNVAAAREHLQREGIAIAAEDVGGNRGRKLIFRTDTGLAYVKKVTP